MSPTQLNAHVRANQCSICPTPCALQGETAAHHDGCAKCPLIPPAWGVWDCGVNAIEPRPQPPAGSPPVATPTGGHPSLKRRLVAYRRAGVELLTGPARRARSAACAICPHRRETAHKGLYACGKCQVCGGGDEIRMLKHASKCADGRWP